MLRSIVVYSATLALGGAMTLVGCGEAPNQQLAQAPAQPAIPMPENEQRFIAELDSANATAQAQLEQTQNGIRQDAIREDLYRAECKALRSHHVVRNWVARLDNVEADALAPGRASVTLRADDLEIYSEPWGDDRDPPISWVKDMEPGELIKFSGTVDLDLEHAVDRTDCNPVVSNPIYVTFKSMKVIPET